MINYPKISIVTPSFNQGQYLEETILSVINQNYPNLEYIIIDGGSTDNSVEIIKKYEKHLKYWVSEPDRGQSHAINKGLEYCTGEIFNWLNSDDFLAPDSLFKISKAFTENDIDIYSGIIEFVINDKKSGQYWGPTKKMKTLAMTGGYGIVAQQSTFFKLTNIKNIGGVNETLHLIMDRELYIRHYLMFGNPKIYNDYSTIAYFRIYAETKSSSMTRLFHDETLLFFLELAKEFKLSKYERTIPILIENQCEYYKHRNTPNLAINKQKIRKLIGYGLLREADMYSWSNNRKKSIKTYKSIFLCDLHIKDIFRVIKTIFK